MKIKKEKQIKKWEKHYRYDKGVWELICGHGVGHEMGTHGCDGCCSDKSFKKEYPVVPTYSLNKECKCHCHVENQLCNSANVYNDEHNGKKCIHCEPEKKSGECDCCKCYCSKCKDCWHSPCKVHPKSGEITEFWKKLGL